jgi:hypothetical protein
MEPGLSPCVNFLKKRAPFKKNPIVSKKKALNRPLPVFPPSLRIKEPQTKPASLIPQERLKEISWHDFWRSHYRGAWTFRSIFAILINETVNPRYLSAICD